MRHRTLTLRQYHRTMTLDIHISCTLMLCMLHYVWLVSSHLSLEGTHLTSSSFNMRQPGQYIALKLVIVTGFALLSLAFAACANLNSTGTSNPLDLVTPGVLTVASDTTNPPQEFIDPTTEHVTGFDMDLIT